MSVADTIQYARTRLIVVMGTTGCGKSTISEELSRLLNARMLEGDDYHSPENKAKLSVGMPLTDEDRGPWLKVLAETMRRGDEVTVLSCSALKRSYRDVITREAREPVLFIHLSGTKKVLSNRLSSRQGHFMNTDLLDSQLETLEPPQADELSFTVDIDRSVEATIEYIKIQLGR